MVTDHFADDGFEGIEHVVRVAVQCRNRYTHGSRQASSGAAAPIRKSSSAWRFLEPPYATSELLLSGGDGKASPEHVDGRHPVGRLLKSTTISGRSWTGRRSDIVRKCAVFSWH